MKTQNPHNNRLIGAGLIIVAALLWSLDGIYLRPQLYTLNPLMVVVIEHFLGFVLLCPFILAYWKEVKQLRWKEWGSVIMVSAVGGVIGTLAITKAFFAAFAGDTTFASVVILQKLQPIFALILARVLLKEKLKKQFYPFALLAIATSFFLIIDKDFSLESFRQIDVFNHAGVLAFVAALAFGSSTVFGKNLVNHLDHKTSAALRFGVTLLISLLMLVVLGQYRNIFAVNALQWKIFVTIALTSGATAMFFYYQGLRKVSASLATVLELFWPFSAVLLDYFINGNIMTSVQFFAASLLVFFIFKAITSAKENPFVFTAKIIDGDKIGTSIGFPTINLDRQDMPIAHGVYLINADIYGSSIKGLMHFGPKQTFDSRVSTEIYLEKQVNRLPREISVEVKRKIRETRKFVSEKELAAQIKKDTDILR